MQVMGIFKSKLHAFEIFSRLRNIQPLSPQSEPFFIYFFSTLHRSLWETSDTTAIHIIQENERSNAGCNLLSLYGKHVGYCEINLEALLKKNNNVAVTASSWWLRKWPWVAGCRSHVLVPLPSFESLRLLKMKWTYSLNSFVKLCMEEGVVSMIFFFSI